MQKLIKRGDQLAQKKLRKARAEIKSVLTEELPSHIRVEEIADGISIQSPNLDEQLAENSSLRDVAFLMKGVR